MFLLFEIEAVGNRKFPRELGDREVERVCARLESLGRRRICEKEKGERLAAGIIRWTGIPVRI